jgi:hypothetical protein
MIILKVLFSAGALGVLLTRWIVLLQQGDESAYLVGALAVMLIYSTTLLFIMCIEEKHQ